MQKSKKNFKKRVGNDGCEACGYNKHKEILTLHHIYPKRNGHQSSQAQEKSRRERYLCVCPNCHVLIERGIIKGKKLLKEILSSQIHSKSSGSEINAMGGSS